MTSNEHSTSSHQPFGGTSSESLSEKVAYGSTMGELSVSTVAVSEVTGTRLCHDPLQQNFGPKIAIAEKKNGDGNNKQIK